MSSDAKSWKHYLSPSFVVGKVREEGVVGFTLMLLKFIQNSIWQSTRPVRVKFDREHRADLRKRVFWVVPGFRFLLRQAPQTEKRILAICDFRTIPYTVGELLHFQAMTLKLRIEHGVDKVDIVWLYDPKNPARGPDQGITPSNYYYYLSTLLPLAHVNPHLGSFMLMDSRQSLESYILANLHRYYVWPPFRDYTAKRWTFPQYYNSIKKFYTEHGFIPHLSCKPAMVLWAHLFIEREVRPYLPIVVHLRNSRATPRRNARFESWQEFFTFCAAEFSSVRFIVIGGREEIDPRLRGLENVIFSKDYGTTVEQDLALVQVSAMYLGVTSGPCVMAVLSDIPYLVFKYFPVYADIPFGSQTPFATPLQKLVWEPDTAKLLIDEFTNLFRRIDVSQWEQRFSRLLEEASAEIRPWY